MPTSPQVRRAIRASDLGIRALARLYRISPTTVAKWKRRGRAEDARRGPRPGVSAALTVNEEKMIDTFRRYTLLPIDDCLYALQLTIPHLTRSTLHRCLRRRGISRLADIPPPPFERDRIGTFFVGVSRTGARDGPAYLCFAIDHVSRLIHVEVFDAWEAATPAALLARLRSAAPYRVSRIVTSGPGSLFPADVGEVEHLRISADHPWARGFAEAEPGFQRRPETARTDLRRVAEEFVHRYNGSRRLKALQGRTPRQHLVWLWRAEPAAFVRAPDPA